MLVLPLIMNGLVIVAILMELIAITLGLATSDQLLIVSCISAVTIFFSIRLSKIALAQPDTADQSLEIKMGLEK